MAIRRGKAKVVPQMIHRCAVEATKEYAEEAVRCVQVHLHTLRPEAERALNTAWLIYLLALRMSSGELPAPEPQIARERLSEVIDEVRRTLEKHIRSRKPIAKQLHALKLDDLREAASNAKSLMGHMIAISRKKATYTFPQVPGTAYLLKRTSPEVLMRRAVIAQLLSDRTNATQRDMCARLDYYNCPVPGEWRETLEDVEGVSAWKSSFKSASLRGRVKKLLSDDVQELRKWG